MTSREIELPSAVGAPDRLGQATVIEQSRAIAEVQGAILVAQRCPRNVPAAAAAMRDSCGQKFLADRAFFAVPRGGKTVNGASVHLARELARTWGNVQYGVSEMRRDDQHGQSEMVAFAWDVQTNTRVETKFVVPHIRDRKAEYGGPIKLSSMDDIYMNNANAGARRVRECIFSILPPWFVEEAKSLCQQTLEHGGGKPLEQRIADALRSFSDEFGVVADQLEARIGRPHPKWSARDVAQLSVLYQSLARGELRVEEEFPPVRVTVEELSAPPAAQAPSGNAPVVNGAPKPAATSDSVEGVSREQLDALNAALANVGVTEGVDRLATVRKLTGIPQLSTTSNLAPAQADKVIATLERLGQRPEPARELDVYLANLDEGEAQG